MLFTQSKNATASHHSMMTTSSDINPRSKISMITPTRPSSKTDLSSSNTLTNSSNTSLLTLTTTISFDSKTSVVSNPPQKPSKLPPLQLSQIHSNSSSSTNSITATASSFENTTINEPPPPSTPRVINIDKYFSLSQYIHDQEASQVFHQFLKKKRNEESLEFLLELNELKKIPPSHTQSIEESLQRIRKQYLVSGAVSELNVSRAAKVHALERIDRYLVHQLNSSSSIPLGHAIKINHNNNALWNSSPSSSPHSLFMLSPSSSNLDDESLMCMDPNHAGSGLSSSGSGTLLVASSSSSTPPRMTMNPSSFSSSSSSLSSSPTMSNILILQDPNRPYHNNNFDTTTSAISSQTSRLTDSFSIPTTLATNSLWNASHCFKELELEVRLQLQNESFKEFKASDEFEHFVLTKVIEQSMNHQPPAYPSSYVAETDSLSSSPSSSSGNMSSSPTSNNYSSNRNPSTTSSSAGFFAKLFKRKEGKNNSNLGEHSPTNNITLIAGSYSPQTTSSSNTSRSSGDSWNSALFEGGQPVQEDLQSLEFMENVPLRRWTTQQTIAFFQFKLELPEYTDQIKKHEIKGMDLRVLKKENDHRSGNNSLLESTSSMNNSSPIIPSSSSFSSSYALSSSPTNNLSQQEADEHHLIQQKKIDQLYKKLKMAKLGHKKKLMREVNEVLTKYYKQQQLNLQQSQQQSQQQAQRMSPSSSSLSSLSPQLTDQYPQRAKRSLSQPQELVAKTGHSETDSLNPQCTVIIKLTILPLNQKRVFTVKSHITMDQLKQCILKEISDLLEMRGIDKSSYGSFFEHRSILSNKDEVIQSNEELREFLSQKFMTSEIPRGGKPTTHVYPMTSPFAHIKIEI
ncbi:hypothetical protein FDP41_010632 [Naegleria fowleri]|uniref:RGS domain-containing protein n=1 Tax=Naegleria fowleri TaxID=5763 RepID=A0A6A5C2E5_NAEFO|nr:uncharacterized protein FDP41_010632 [Naegleria fowleri]KAF0983567.1 hypothetical protein FDP41_010632 [Naegleria fowleri]